MNRFEIIVEVDENDADYRTEVSEIDQEDLDLIKPLIKAIKAKGIYHNYEIGECGDANVVYPQFNDEVHEIFQECCPTGEYGFHTVVSIYVSPLPTSKTRLL